MCKEIKKLVKNTNIFEKKLNLLRLEKVSVVLFKQKNNFHLLSRGCLLWSEWLQPDLGVVHQSIERTCIHFMDTLDRVGLGSWPSGTWQGSMTCRIDIGNDTGLSSDSWSGFVRWRVSGTRSLRGRHKWHNTGSKIWMKGNGNTPRCCHQVYGWCWISWVSYDEGM